MIRLDRKRNVMIVKAKTIGFLVSMSLLAFVAFAQGKGQGGIVTATEEVPVFDDSEGDEILRHAKPGEAFAGITMFAGGRTRGGGSDGWVAQEEAGRLRIITIPTGEDGRPNGMSEKGWIRKDDVALFWYECGCGRKKDACSPLMQAGGWRPIQKWNPCFEEALDQKRASLHGGMSESVEQRLRKLDDLLKSGIITKEEYDRKRREILEDL